MNFCDRKHIFTYHVAFFSRRGDVHLLRFLHLKLFWANKLPLLLWRFWNQKFLFILYIWNNSMKSINIVERLIIYMDKFIYLIDLTTHLNCANIKISLCSSSLLYILWWKRRSSIWQILYLGKAYISDNKRELKLLHSQLRDKRLLKKLRIAV